MALPQAIKDYEVYTDVNGKGLEAVLMQEGSVIAYASRASEKS